MMKDKVMNIEKYLDKQDILVLAGLRKNAREKLTTISRRIQLPVSTIYDRMAHLSKTVIKKKTILLDFSRIGYNTRIILVLKVQREQRDEVKKFLLKSENLNNLYKINNGFDFLCEMVFEHVKDMEDFIEDFETKFKVLHRDTHYIIDEIERECFLDQDRMFIKNKMI
ncbi:MAG: hypothetical protein Q8O89_03475 [Nanoarchaeota archaeon]|nr:hypothetical protein [Nanoarchaeota archaeon]